MNIEEKIDKLEQELNELKKQAKWCKTKYWKPKNGEKAWYIESGNISSSCQWVSPLDKTLITLGNVFQSEEEAKKELKLRLATQRLKESIWTANGGEFVGYNIHSMNYTVTVFRGKLIVNYFNDTKIAQDWMYFKDRETAIKVLEENRRDF